jgi:hypothetical protein
VVALFEVDAWLHEMSLSRTSDGSRCNTLAHVTMVTRRIRRANQTSL